MKLTSLIAICATFLALLARADFDPSTSTLPKATIDAVSELCDVQAEKIMPAALRFSDGSSETVSREALITALMSRGFAQADSDTAGIEDEAERNQYERIQKASAEGDRLFARSIHVDENGNITEKAFSEAIRDVILSSLERMGPLDADRDERLSLAEYALSMPVTEGQEKDAEGFTERQRHYFEEQDADDNGYIEGIEYLGGRWEYVEGKVDQFIAMLEIDRADLDADGTLSGEEIEAVLPDLQDSPESLALNESAFWIRGLSNEEAATLLENIESTASDT